VLTIYPNNRNANQSIAIAERAAAEEDASPHQPYMNNAPIYAQGNTIFKHMHPAIQNNELRGVHFGLQNLRDAEDADPEGNFKAYLDALLDKQHIAKNKFLPPGWATQPAREIDDDEMDEYLAGDADAGNNGEGVGEDITGDGNDEEDEGEDEWEDIEDDEDLLANFMVGNTESDDEGGNGGDAWDGASLSGSVELEFDTVEEKERFEAMLADAIQREEERKEAEKLAKEAKSKGKAKMA
jgi:hypothetical protein